MANTIAQAYAWALAHPTKNVGREPRASWAGWCAALMWWVGGPFPDGTEVWSATEGKAQSFILSGDYTKAVPGAFHWWLDGGDGHVGLDLTGGGARVLMASSRRMDEKIGNGIGVISMANYGTRGYAGWSLDFNRQQLADVGTPAPGLPAPGPGQPAPGPRRPSVSVEDGKLLQRVAQRGGYTGPVDGDLGVNSWRGVQTVVRGYGYVGPIDGVPGENTWKGVQTLARAGGYTGPIDGVPGPNTYAGLARWLNSATPTPPIPIQPTPPAPVPVGMRGVYGIDVGTTQRSLDFEAVRGAGYQYAIVKAGGSNVSPIYVAPFYQQQVAAARAAGLIVGHYWVAGSTDPVGDANFFVDHLYDYRAGDILALDNEAIDDGIFWNDSRTAEFMQRVIDRLHVVPFLYTYSSLLTSIPWPQTRALGAKLWIAHYTQTPGNPSIGNAFPDWDIHQYTSSGSLAGIRLDINVAKLSAFTGLSQPPSGETAPPPNSIPGTPTPTTPVAPTVLSLTVEQWKVIQNLAARGGYTGPVDGVMGTNSWRGVQSVLRSLGHYTGPADGVPGLNTYRGLQLLARVGGYTGPIDGVPGTNTVNGIQAYLTANTTGTPSITTAQAITLQKIARAGGYTGPIDGVMGGNSWRGIQQVLSGYSYTGPIDGGMGRNSYSALQKLAAKGGYTGPIDGVMGRNSWRGIQTILRGFGYTGPLDGDMGTNSWRALQRLAKIGGYTGPIDGDLGSNSWRGVQRVLTGSNYSGPIDGTPGPNTYRALQELAGRGGYGGPLDGVPGSNMHTGLATLVS